MPSRPAKYQPFPPRPAGLPAGPTFGKRPSACRQGYDRTWQALSKSHLASNPTCVGILPDGSLCLQPARHVDHIVPFDGLSDPLRLDLANLQSLCVSCHSRKGAKDRRTRQRGG